MVMEKPDSLYGLFQYYLNVAAFDIGELERRCAARRVLDNKVLEEGVPYSKLLEVLNEAPKDDKAPVELYYPQIHSEIRMAFTHVSRAVIGLCDKDGDSLRDLLEATPAGNYKSLEALVRACCVAPNDEYQKKEIEGANGHLLRARMDARKGQFETTELVVRSVFDYYLKYGIYVIDGKRLISEFEKRSKRSRNLYEKGKLAEALGNHSAAVSIYGDAVCTLDEAGEYLGYHAPSLDTTKILYEARRSNRLLRLGFKTGIDFVGWLEGHLPGA